MTTQYTRTPIIRERYVPRTKPEHERNRSQEEARRVRQAQRNEARRGERMARFQAALVEIADTGSKAATAMRALATHWVVPVPIAELAAQENPHA